jgi:hypothetical protein
MRKEEKGFSVGGILITDNNGDEVKIVFQNEYLQALKRIQKPGKAEKSKSDEMIEKDETTGNYYKSIAIVPHLIIVVDYETSLPISCGQLKYGQRVRVLTMNAPKKLLTKQALEVVGPQAFNLKKLMPALSGKPLAISSALFGKPDTVRPDTANPSVPTPPVADLAQLPPVPPPAAGQPQPHSP